MQRETLGRRVARLVRSRWTLILSAGLTGAVGLFAAILLGVVNVIGRSAVEVPACEAATPTPPDFEAEPFAFDPESQAYAFVKAMADDDFQTAYSMLAYDPHAGGSLCDYTLESFWSSRIGSHSSLDGEFVVERPAIAQDFYPFEDVIFVQYALRIENDHRSKPSGHIVVQVWRDGRVSLFDASGVDDGKTALIYPVPPYADLSSFEDLELNIQGTGGKLGATLAIPHGPGPFPGVVLVPGTWETLFTDRDATTPRIKPLRDLAWGLASRGIATLRYDPRTSAHAAAAAQQRDFTLTDEYVDDALAAVDLLRGLPRIDPDRIHVLAFERAGFAGPRIAQRDPDLAGLILFSAPSGTLWDSFLSIIEREFRTDFQEELGSSDAEVRMQARDHVDRELAVYKAYVAEAKTVSVGGTVSNIRLRPTYHRDLASYRPVDAARSLQMPILVLHGDLHRLGSGAFNGWLESLHQRPNAVFHLYSSHFDYLLDMSKLVDAVRASDRARLIPHHVAPKAVEDIASWISGHQPSDVCTGTQTGPKGCRGGPEARISRVTKL